MSKINQLKSSDWVCKIKPCESSC